MRNPFRRESFERYPQIERCPQYRDEAVEESSGRCEEEEGIVGRREEGIINANAEGKGAYQPAEAVQRRLWRWRRWSRAEGSAGAARGGEQN